MYGKYAVETMEITIPEHALVLLIGPSGSGKSTFAEKRFRNTEVISSDKIRGLISDDEANWAITQDAFDVIFLLARKRLKYKRLTVVDAMNLHPEHREPLLRIASQFATPVIGIVFDMSPEICHTRNQARATHQFPFNEAQRHSSVLHRYLQSLKKEGFKEVFILTSETAVQQAVVTREPAKEERA